ncbi:MAG: hypothetical protein GX118_06405 [Arcobacter butzleri]|jgi:hypothetical protein|nr:hypothetical protein [Arcobacteraceae bacterium]MDY0364897.1 hypothetical protein [Arcobacteraceae bacterium]NLO17806.1 hypothetical protein [Aliarcobacter butzleri]
MINQKDAKQIEVNGATVPFYEYEENGVKHYYFDSSQTPPPEPMVNAMVGLQLIKDNEKLVMVNHKSPQGLFPKIEGEFEYSEDSLDDGRAVVILQKRAKIYQQTDFSQNSCSGGGACGH